MLKCIGRVQSYISMLKFSVSYPKICAQTYLAVLPSCVWMSSVAPDTLPVHVVAGVATEVVGAQTGHVGRVVRVGVWCFRSPLLTGQTTYCGAGCAQVGGFLIA